MNKGPLAIPWETMTALVRYPWPGNIRELQNVIERAVIVSNGSVLKLSAEEFPQCGDAPHADNHGNGNLRATLAGTERQEIVAALQKFTGKVAGPNGAAALLGMNRSTPNRLRHPFEHSRAALITSATCSTTSAHMRG